MTWDEIQSGLDAGKVATLDDRILIFKQIPCTVEGQNIDFMRSVPDLMKEVIHRNKNRIQFVEQYIQYEKETGLATNYFPTDFARQTNSWKFVIK